jgi:hypothetical protein
MPRPKTSILPLGTYSRPSRLEDWDPSQFSDSILTRARRLKELLPGQAISPPSHYDAKGQVTYEMEDTSIVHEMADTSIQAPDSEPESGSDEDVAV